MKNLIILIILIYTDYKLSAQTSTLKKTEMKAPIFFLLTDNQIFKTITLNNKEIETPNMDKLSDQWVTFTHFFNRGSRSGAVEGVGSPIYDFTGSAVVGN